MMNACRYFLFSIFMLFPLLAYSESHLTNIQVSNTNNSSQVVLSLSQATRYRVFTLDHPYRLVIDLEETRSHVKLKSLVVTGISGIRSGYPSEGVLRLVFDIANPLRYQYSFNANKNQLTLELSLVASRIPEYASKETLNKPISQPASKERRTPIVKLPARKQAIVVVIDPGHGGKDTGAIGARGIKEKNVVLAISKKLADFINQQAGMRAVLTRNTDYFVPLRDRLRLARRGKADIFIAVHADAYFNNNARGASVYALSKRGATSEAARWIAKRDNYSELGGVDLEELDDQSYMLRSILIDLAQTATISDSLHLGGSILNALDKVTKLHYSRVEQAPFVVLKSPDIPSVLVETGFISNTREALRLNDPQYQNKIARALFFGVQKYLQKHPPGI